MTDNQLTTLVLIFIFICFACFITFELLQNRKARKRINSEIAEDRCYELHAISSGYILYEAETFDCSDKYKWIKKFLEEVKADFKELNYNHSNIVYDNGEPYSDRKKALWVKSSEKEALDYAFKLWEEKQMGIDLNKLQKQAQKYIDKFN